MKRCSKFIVRFKSYCKNGILNIAYENDYSSVLQNFDCSKPDRKFLVPANWCSVEFLCKETENDVVEQQERSLSSCRLECYGIERPGRFAIGNDLLNLLLNDNCDVIDTALPWKLVWLWTIEIALTCHPKFLLKSMSLLRKIMQIFLKNPSKYRHLEIDLRYLRPFWSILKPINDRNYSMPSVNNGQNKVVSDLTRSCMALFSLAEQLATEWHVTQKYAEDYVDVTSCTQAYVQGVNVVAALSAILEMENKATYLVLALCQKADLSLENMDADGSRPTSPTTVYSPTVARSRSSSESSRLSLPTLLNSFADI